MYAVKGYVPQHRERIVIVGFDKERYGEDISFSFDLHPLKKQPVVRDILEKEVSEKYTLSDKLWIYLQNYAAKHREAGNGFGYGIAPLNGVTRTISARYYKDGSEILIEQRGKNPGFGYAGISTVWKFRCCSAYVRCRKADCCKAGTTRC